MEHIFRRIDNVWLSFISSVSEYDTEAYEMWIPKNIYNELHEHFTRNMQNPTTGNLTYKPKIIKLVTTAIPESIRIESYDGDEISVRPRGYRLMNTKLGREIL